MTKEEKEEEIQLPIRELVAEDYKEIITDVIKPSINEGYIILHCYKFAQQEGLIQGKEEVHHGPVANVFTKQVAVAVEADDFITMIGEALGIDIDALIKLIPKQEEEKKDKSDLESAIKKADKK